MRLTCPNCGAQYEVPDEVIPTDGRDVQCSNCGNTWFQNHPDAPEQSIELEEDAAQSWEATEDLDDAPVPDLHDPDVQDAYADETGQPVSRAPRPHDSEVMDVLREEAERESQLRAQEEPDPLESQPDLGLDRYPDDPEHRAHEARARMARLRGEPTTAPKDDTSAATDQDTRRGLLPDIDDINSSLKSSSTAVAPALAPDLNGSEPAPAKKSRFSLGFAIAILLATGLLLAYTNAPAISEALPQVDPALNVFVATVDNARLWLDQMLLKLTPATES